MRGELVANNIKRAVVGRSKRRDGILKLVLCITLQRTVGGQTILQPADEF